MGLGFLLIPWLFDNNPVLLIPRLLLKLLCSPTLTLFLFLFFRFGVSSSNSSSSWKPSPFSSASRTLYSDTRANTVTQKRLNDPVCRYQTTWISSKVSSSLQRLFFFSSTPSPLRRASKAVASPGGTSRFGASSASKRGTGIKICRHCGLKKKPPQPLICFIDFPARATPTPPPPITKCARPPTNTLSDAYRGRPFQPFHHIWALLGP